MASGLIVPDFSEIKDFEDESDARLYSEGKEESLPAVNTDNLSSEFQRLEERLQEMRKDPLKQTIPAAAETAEGEEEEPLKALYFVRLPKPDFDSPAYDLLQKDFEAQLAQVKKDRAREDTNRALQCLKEANERVNSQKNKVNPLRKVRNEDRLERARLKEKRRALAASTEAELDRLIRSLEFRMEHETIPLSEEKRLHVEIKSLKASRPEVREYEQKMKENESTMSTREDTTSSKEHLEKELKEFKNVQSDYERVYKDLREAERKAKDEFDQVCSHLDVAVKKKEAIYAKLSAARQRRKQRKTEWQNNRDFHRRISGYVEERNIDVAQAECRLQVEEIMTLLLTNEEYRNEYLALWSTKRTSPMAIFEDKTEVKKKQSHTKAAAKKSALHANIQVLPGQSISEAVVAEQLKEAVAAIQGKTVKREVEQKPVKPEVVEAPAAAKPKEKPVPAPASKKPSKAMKKVVHDDFELPKVVAQATEASQSTETMERSDSISEAIEKERKERQEAIKKKKAEQAKKKKEREEELKMEKAEMAKAKEAAAKTAQSQTKKQPTQHKKQSSRPRSIQDSSIRRALNTNAAKTVKRKPKPGLEQTLQSLKAYPILVGSVIAALIALIVYLVLP